MMDVPSEIKKKVRYTLIIIPILIVVIIIILLILGIKISFFISEELDLGLEPLHASFDIKNNEDVKVNFTIHNNNFQQCSALCTYSLKDLYDNKIILIDTRTFEHNEKLNKQFIIPAIRRGYGQRLYHLKIQCHNIRTYICLTDNSTKEKTALITVNYNLTEQEEKIIPSIKENIEQFLFDFKNTTSLLDQSYSLQQRIPDLIIEKETLANKFEGIKIEFQLLFDKRERMIHFYEQLQLADLMLEFPTEIKKVNSKLVDLRDRMMSILQSRNQNKAILEEYNSKRSSIIAMMDEFNNQNSEHNQALFTHIKSNSKKINTLSEEFDKLHSENLVRTKLVISMDEINEQLLEFEKTKQQGKIYRLWSNSLLAVEESLVPNYQLIDYNCENLPTSDNISLRREAFELLTFHFKDTNTEILINKYINPNDTDDMDIFIERHCADKIVREYTISLLNITIDNVDDSFPETSFPLNINLSFPKPRCCISNQCHDCCENDCDNLYPVLFIHGHAFNEANSPEYSMQEFNKIQNRLEGYVNAGQLGLTDDDDLPSLERTPAPLTVRASYYYIPHINFGSYAVSVQKSERIENYALRLHEVIDDVKKWSGRNKVIIVAHSMGGLVARQYISLFGSQNVQKLITINTPHQGISGKVATYCSILGSKKECDDMTKGSVFLNRLNAKPLPDIPIISIRSSGCTMEGRLGDGIVTEESAILVGANNILIKGTCTDSLNSNLHSDVLNIDKYPETLKILKEALK